MAERLHELQTRFAAHISNPQENPAPEDVEDRRMEIYRGLFFRNLRNLLAKSFPVLARIHSEAEFSGLVRAFYSDYRCHTPLFPELPREFLQYLQEQRPDSDPARPFLLELAHYEWVELALDTDQQDLDRITADREGDLLTGVPVLSPLAWPLSYRFPVHQIRPDFQPIEPPTEATHLVVYRNREERVKFMQLNAVSALLLQNMKEHPGHTGLDLLQAVAEALQHPQPEVVIEGGKTLLADLLQRDVILGTQAA